MGKAFTETATIVAPLDWAPSWCGGDVVDDVAPVQDMLGRYPRLDRDARDGHGSTTMPPALTYLLLTGCAAVFFGVFLLDRRSVRARYPRLSRFAFVIQGAALVAAYLVLRPGRGVDGRAAIETASAEGRPLLLDLYSNS